ncbi:MAG TPA: exodeoxyribonuclease VII large subunit [Gemmatimonadaceae bacterium]|nr:exodeoxyribonuclease VII large subunit [Gemmatimonadaceae bacterium]
MTERRPPRGRRARQGPPADDLGLFEPGVGSPKKPAARTARPLEESRPAGETRSPSPIPGLSPESAVSISTLTRTAKDVLEGAFTPLWVRGEVSDFKSHRNGHWYFWLRDESAQIRCVVWSRDQFRIPASPDDGMQVVALGQLSVYTARGDMQLAVRALTADGDGLRRKALERIIARLRGEGLLAPERRRPIPRHPRRVAVITSQDGAALHDIVAVIRRRCPMVEIVLAPARVQGEGAADELCAAIERVSRWGAADTLIIGRGGGARDDLWVFNDERVARALAACPIPTISAVGHEVDVTVCDLVADLRAPTPSAAAEAAVPSRDALRAELRHVGNVLAEALARRVSVARRRLETARREVGTQARLSTERRRARLQGIAGALNALSPLAVLSRGYAVAQDDQGNTLSDVAAFEQGLPFRLVLRDGTVQATTDAVEPSE